MVGSTFVYVTYIRTTPERLWSALTDDAEFMKQYWFGVHCESQWTEGSGWKMVHGDGQITDAGEIVAVMGPDISPKLREDPHWLRRNHEPPELIDKMTSPVEKPTTAETRLVSPAGPVLLRRRADAT